MSPPRSAEEVRYRDARVGACLEARLARRADGILVLLPDPKHLYWSLTPLSEAKQKQIAAERRYARPRIDTVNMPEVASAMVGAQAPGHISYFSRLHGQDEHAGFAPVPANDWVVGVTEPRASFEAPLRQLFQNVRRSVGLVGLAFLTFAVLFARSIVRPIRRLTDAADALKQGDYDRASIKVTNNDEIGRLARTFNVLIDVLRQRERERRTGAGGRRSGRRKDDQPPPG
jgi:HAMP domain-containing protein